MGKIMQLDIEVEDEELIIYVPRKMIMDKANQASKKNRPANIGDIVNKIVQEMENATSQGKEQESNQSKYQDRDCSRKAAEASHSHRDERSRHEQEEEKEVDYISQQLFDKARRFQFVNPDLCDLLMALLSRVDHINNRLEIIEEYINEEIYEGDNG
jgi:hypothetical protein